MDAERIAIARRCLDDAHVGGRSFPEIVGELIAAGFEAYSVDYRRSTQTYYLPDGADVFDAPAVGSLVRWAQANGPDYSYNAFCRRVKAAGCAGYIVSFLGRRVVYLGRTGETHVELFP